MFLYNKIVSCVISRENWDILDPDYDISHFKYTNLGNPD